VECLANIERMARPSHLPDTCDDVSLCPFFAEYHADLDAIRAQIWIRLYCHDRERSRLCLHRQYRPTTPTVRAVAARIAQG
jgi:hypothetical protein